MCTATLTPVLLLLPSRQHNMDYLAMAVTYPLFSSLFLLLFPFLSFPLLSCFFLFSLPFLFFLSFSLPETPCHISPITSQELSPWALFSTVSPCSRGFIIRRNRLDNFPEIYQYLFTVALAVNLLSISLIFSFTPPSPSRFFLSLCLLLLPRFLPFPPCLPPLPPSLCLCR